MQLELQAELFLRYPKSFRREGDWGSADFVVLDERGIECDDGWFHLVERLAAATEREIERLTEQKADKRHWPKVAQVKEKLALRLQSAIRYLPLPPTVPCR